VSQALKQLLLPFDLLPWLEKPGRVRRLQLSGGVLGYRLVRARRRSVALAIDAEGLEVRAPRWVSVIEVETFIREKERWIRKRLAELRRTPFVWEYGAKLPWLGQTLTLVLRADGDSVQLCGDTLEVGLADGTGLRARVLGWIRDRALVFFRQRVDMLSQAHGLQATGVGLSDARRRWGSCGAGGRVLLNWRLMLMSDRLIDYVIAHELAHLRELNHSPRFWAVVARLYPDYPSARRELSQLGRTLPDL
jgi:predicted metal-dependent hydrolase